MHTCSVVYLLIAFNYNIILDTTFEVEEQFILWNVSTSSTFNGRWSLLPSLKHPQKVQPLDDHTYRQYRQCGHYMLQAQMESQNRAVLITSVIQNNICGIRFWVYRNIGARYKIVVSAIYQNKLSTQLHESRASDHDLEIWHSKEGATQMDLFGAKIMLQVTSWNSSKGQVAIDDIEFTECAGQLDRVLYCRCLDVVHSVQWRQSWGAEGAIPPT